MLRLWVLWIVVLLSAGCSTPGAPTPSSGGSVSFTDAEKVHGVALARRYVQEQGLSPEQAIYRLDEQVSSPDGDGSQGKSRQMFVTVEFKDREAWRLLVLPDGTLRRVETAPPPTAEPAAMP